MRCQLTPGDTQNLTLATAELSFNPTGKLTHEAVEALTSTINNPTAEAMTHTQTVLQSARRYHAARTAADYWYPTGADTPITNSTLETLIDEHTHLCVVLTSAITILDGYLAGLKPTTRHLIRL